MMYLSDCICRQRNNAKRQYICLYNCKPGEYDQNQCSPTNISCTPCPERHANCKDLGNGTRPFSGKLWGPKFAQCLLNRTLNQGQCASGFFHPVAMKCTSVVNTSKYK